VSDELLLAIDAGTGSCRAGVFSADGTQLAMGQREYAHAELPGAPARTRPPSHRRRRSPERPL